MKLLSGARTIKIMLFGLIMGAPILLSALFPQFKWIFFFVIAVEIYAMVSKRIRSKTLTFFLSAILIYFFYQFWYILGGIFMFYWIAGSLGFGMLSSIIIFGVGEK